jgi:orotate phosphoribosyltransferase
MKKEKLLAKIKKVEIVRKGQFKLRSGITSSLYCDTRKLFGDPNLLLAISRTICKILPKGTTCIAGSGYGGLPFAAAVALVGKIKLSAVRNEKKSHGIKKSIEGYVPGMKDKIVIIDDLFTTGSSILDTAKELKKGGAKVIGAIVVIKRSKIRNFLIPLQYLFTLEEIIN